MQRYRLHISYDGTGYAGWQVQPNGVTVQEKIQQALQALCREKAKVHGSGRTDQGVHARKQVAHVDLRGPIDAKTLRRGLNALLPEDIRILRVMAAPDGFHARRSARGKEYRYFIWNAEVCPPCCRQYKYRVRNRLDVSKMSRAAAILEGRHDFAAFTANPNRYVETTVR